MTSAAVRRKLVAALVRRGGPRARHPGQGARLRRAASSTSRSSHTFGGHSSCVQLEHRRPATTCCATWAAAPAAFGNHVLATRRAARPPLPRLHVAPALGPHHGLPVLRARLHRRATTSASTAATTRSRRRSAGSTAPPSFPVDFSRLGATHRVRAPRARARLRRRRPARHAPSASTTRGDSYGYRFERRRARSSSTRPTPSTSSTIRRRPRRSSSSSATPTWSSSTRMYSLADAISVKEDWGHSSNVVGVELCQLARAPGTSASSTTSRRSTTQRIARVLAETRRFEEITRGDHAAARSPRPTTGWRSRCEGRLTASEVAGPRPRRTGPSGAGSRLLGGARPAARRPAARPAAGRAAVPSPGLRSCGWPPSTPTSASRRGSARRRPVVIVDDRRGEPARATASGRGRARCWPGSWTGSRARCRRHRPRHRSCRSPTGSRRERLAGLLDRHSIPELAAALAALPSNDAVLAAALRGRPVVLGVAGVDGRSAASRSRAGAGHAPVRAVGGDPAPFVRRFDGGAADSWTRSTAAAAGHGLINVDPERRRRSPHPALAAVGDVLMPTLALEMLRVAARTPGDLGAVRRGGIAGRRRRRALASRPSATARVWLHYVAHDPAPLRLGGRRARRRASIPATFEQQAGAGRRHRARASPTRPRRWATGWRASRSTPSSSRASSTARCSHGRRWRGLVEAAVLPRRRRSCCRRGAAPAAARCRRLLLLGLLALALGGRLRRSTAGACCCSTPPRPRSGWRVLFTRDARR